MSSRPGTGTISYHTIYGALLECKEVTYAASNGTPASLQLIKMLAPSSPIAFPSSSAPVITKRPRSQDATKSAKARATGGFIDDDSDEDGEAIEPFPKRRMLEQDEKQVEAGKDDESNNIDLAESREEAPQGGISTPPDSQPADDSPGGA